jgi:diacylglycerol kinase family enzyme
MRVIIVHNPRAGEMRYEPDSLVELARAAGHEPEYFDSNDDEWRPAARRTGDVVVAAGGDGTVARVANELAGTDAALAVLPLGTANNISVALGQTDQSIEGLIAGWAGAARQPFDLGRVSGPWGTEWFLEGVGAGLIAESMAYIKKQHSAGVESPSPREASDRLDAARSVFRRVLRDLKSARMAVSCDGVNRSGDYVLAEVLNFGAAGPNLQLARRSSPSDGLLDVVLVEAGRRDDLLDHLEDRAGPARELPVHQTRSVTMSCDACLIHLDDRLWQPDAGERNRFRLDMSVAPRALTVLVPRSAE